jgi:hypothetical protein
VPPDASLSTGAAEGCVTISAAMRALVIALILATGCGGKQAGPSGPSADAAFPAARWVPGTPTYVVTARTMRDAQRAFRDIVDTFGMAIGADAEQISARLEQMLTIDPLSAEALAAIGVDLDGSVVAFSEDVSPTFIIHLASPPAMQAFFDAQRQRGLVTQSVVVDGSNVHTAKVASDLGVSWVLEKDWLWVHFGAPGESTAWFTQSKRPTSSAWVGKWQAAQQLAQKAAGLVGFVELKELVAKIATRAPEIAGCAQLVSSVRGVSIAVEGEGTYVGGKIAVDLASTQGIAGSLLAPPPGWDSASARAPLAAQWNLDLRAFGSWSAPCLPGPGLNEVFDHFGVRSGRVFVHKLDPDDKSGVGVVSLDLSHRNYFAKLLDEIPMRSKFEKSRAYGAYKGKHLSVPFVATVDYVLDDRVFLAAMGDGMLERAATGAPPAQPALIALDLIPPGLSAAAWTWLFTEADLPAPERFAVQLQAWANIHFGAHLDRERLVIEAQGNRR